MLVSSTLNVGLLCY